MKTCPKCGSHHVLMFTPDDDRCIECNSYFPAVADVKTNGDHIRQLDNDTLAYIIDERLTTLTYSPNCNERACKHVGDSWHCVDCWREWLNQEYKADDDIWKN